MTPAEKADLALSEVHNYSHYGHAIAAAVTGVGWAVRDLADAVRESHSPIPAPSSRRCPHCGPGYHYGDDGCRHTPPEGVSS